MQVMNLIEICYEDADVLVCVKPPRVLSTDEPGGLPSLLRQTLGEPEADSYNASPMKLFLDIPRERITAAGKRPGLEIIG